MPNEEIKPPCPKCYQYQQQNHDICPECLRKLTRSRAVPPPIGLSARKTLKSQANQRTRAIVICLAVIIAGFSGFWLLHTSALLPKKSNSSPITQSAKYACSDSVLNPREARITGTGINVRAGPSTNFEKIINQKATTAIGSTHYVNVDSGVSATEFCQLNGWSYIEVSEPDWLQNSHKGWIHGKFVKGFDGEGGGPYEFVEADFMWDQDTTPFKSTIIAGVNKVAQENDRCTRIDPTSVYLSKSKSTPDNPVFFVTCGIESTAFNVFFSRTDIEGNVSLSAKRHINESSAIRLCEDHVKTLANFPKSVKFSKLLNLSIMEHANGRTRVSSTFEAKNALGMETEFSVNCFLDAAGLIDVEVIEK